MRCLRMMKSPKEARSLPLHPPLNLTAVKGVKNG